MTTNPKVPPTPPTPDPRIIQKTNISPDARPNRRLKTLWGNAYLYPGAIGTQSSFSAIEHFAPGETVSWSFMGDEWHYILKGEAEVTYSLGATLHTEERRMQVKKGDLYLIPAGARLTWKVAPGEPLLHLCVVILLSGPRTENATHAAPGSVEQLP
jgi:mannose-6-phosphate isomerase-like protein (cupin superfamily)